MIDVLGPIVSGLGIGAASGLAYTALHGSRQITRPYRSIPESTPDELGRRWEALSFSSPDGVPLSAWLLPNASTTAAVIVLHGFGGNKGTMINVIEMLAGDFNVLALDVRGHGESGGAWTSVGHFERLDVVAGAEQLYERGLGPIGALGISMGGAIALLAAAESELIHAVVADSAFAVLRHAVLGNARLQGYPPGLAEVAAFTASRAAAARLRHPPGASDPIHAIARITPRPTFLVHCACDLMIPLSEAQALYAASGDPCELWVIPDLAHAESSTVADEYQERVTQFFTAALK
jgi:pimeloyl-ACP methyl ester carboxylesterase